MILCASYADSLDCSCLVCHVCRIAAAGSLVPGKAAVKVLMEPGQTLSR